MSRATEKCPKAVIFYVGLRVFIAAVPGNVSQEDSNEMRTGKVSITL
jgi:hypothetical protein